MRAFDQLLEAVEYSEDLGISWVEQFSDVMEARTILSKAEKQSVDEYDIARLAISIGEEPPDTIEKMNDIKKRCFSKLRRILKVSC